MTAGMSHHAFGPDSPVGWLVTCMQDSKGLFPCYFVDDGKGRDTRTCTGSDVFRATFPSSGPAGLSFHLRR